MAVHTIGEKIVYGSSGVMKIVDIRSEELMGTVREYYVLGEVNSQSAALTYVPRDNEKLVGAMRPLLSPDEARELIAEAADISPLEWDADNRVRNEKFRAVMESGNRRELFGMIKAIREMGKLRLAEGKKNYLSDEHALAKAERLLYSELAEVLARPENEIAELLKL